MRMRVSGMVLSAICTGALAAAGDPDASFLQGQALTLASLGIDQAEQIIVADDGSFAVSGRCGVSHCVARFLVDGRADNRFGMAGVQTFSASALSNPVGVFEYQEDGEVDDDNDGESDDNDDADDIISHHFRLVGHDPANPKNLLLARFNADGSLDASFDVSADADDDSDDSDDVDEDSNDDGVIDENYDQDGVVELVLAGVEVNAEAATMASNGRIVIAGTAQLRGSDAHRTLLITRTNMDGFLDATLYGSGKQFLTLSASGETYTPTVDQVAVDSANRIIVAGHSLDLNHNVGFILRLSANGVLDSDFDGDGIRVLTPNNGAISRVKFDLDMVDRIALVADYSDHDLAAMTELHLLETDGRDREQFNGYGGELLQPNGQRLTSHTIAWQNDGEVLVSGLNPAQQINTIRFESDGSIGSAASDIWQVGRAAQLISSTMTRSGRWLVLAEDQIVALTGDKLTPSAWTFSAQSDVSLATLTASAPVLISGLDRSSLVTVEDGTIALNDEAECDDTLTRYYQLIVENGDYLCAFVTSSADYQATVSAPIRIGAEVNSFAVTTEAEDVDDDIISGSGSWPLSSVLIWLTLYWRVRKKIRN